MINTTKKGDLFEKQIFEIIKNLLDNEEFFVSGKRSKIYWKKSYISKETNSNVSHEEPRHIFKIYL